MSKIAKVETRKKFEKVIDMMMHWKKKLTHKDNQSINPYYPLTMQQACREMWMNIQNFMYYIHTYPELKEKYEDIKIARREKIKNVAEDNIDKAIAWKMDLTDKELVDISFKTLQATEKWYNPKLEIETVSKNLNFNMSDEQIMNKLNQLLKD